MKNMKKSKGIFSLILVAAIIALLTFTGIEGLGRKGEGAAKNIKLGLDLKGGVSITYQVVGGTPSQEDLADTVYKLQRRVEQYSTEATVYPEGEDRISIEIPGISDANEILEELGQPGSLYFIAETGSDGAKNYEVKEGRYQLNKTIEELQADGSVVLTGSDVAAAAARVQEDPTTGVTQNVVDLEFNEAGTEKFAQATQDAVIAKETIGIYYDGEFVSVPTVNSSILNGRAQISGSMTYEDADKLASTIRIGGLNLELEELRSKVVGAQLGEQAINTSLIAGAIGLLLIILFMCIVYRLPGFASSIALVVYTGLVIVLLEMFEITLTLPGIAGIVLNIGMAVDANVIIFARVREELYAGKSVKTALATGFQKATSAIVDGNITTLIAAVVLLLKGSGSVKGFAQTLILGIMVSMFTALFVTRLIIYAFYAVGLRKESLYVGAKKEEKAPINFLGKRRIFFAISAAVIVAGFAFMGINSAQDKGAMNYSLEFTGGTSVTVPFNEEYTLDDIDSNMIPALEDITGDNNIQVQKVEGTNDVIFKMQEMSLEERDAFNTLMVEEYGVDESEIATENIGATVSSEMREDAVVAVVVATIFMLLYIWFRFKDVRFATSAVAALVHDVLVVLAFYVVSRISIGNTFIACMLTIVGYSINATIVIFDRIREELKTKSKSEGLDVLVNRCITKTLTRSIYTSLTTFIMVAVLYVMGVSSIKEFALPLMVGIVCGGYSSVCITGALWHFMKEKFVKKAA